MHATRIIQQISCTEPPVMLNGWKHHIGYLINQTSKWIHKPEQMFPLFVTKLKMMGESQFDLYTGYMEPAAIANELTDTLKGFRAYEQQAYFRWVDSSTNLYWQLPVSDGSEWTLRKGETDDYYIHIHPSRQSKHTQRLKANHLRTALATLVMAAMQDVKPDFPLLNRVRREYLGLSDVSKPMAKEIFTTLNNFASIAELPH